MTPLQLRKAFKVLAYSGSTIQCLAVCATGVVPLMVGATLMWASVCLSIHQLDK
jgi:hypothetical protein